MIIAPVAFQSVFTSVTVLRQNASPVVYSTPPRKSTEGTQQEAQITLLPYGMTMPDDEQSVYINMSIDEAEQLARMLTGVVSAAREGQYSEFREEPKRRSEQTDIEDVWNAYKPDSDAD